MSQLILVSRQGGVVSLVLPADAVRGTLTGALAEEVGAALADPEVTRIQVVAALDDRRARRALHRTGFRLEGVHRSARLVADELVDEATYAVVRGDLLGGAEGFTAVMNSVLPRKRVIAHVLLTDTAGRVCLVDTVFKDDWELPGGIVDPFESPKQGASRELMEELSLDATPGRLLVVDWLGPYLGWEDALELIFDGGTLAPDQVAALRPDPSEIAGIHWLEIDEAAGRMAPFAAGRLLAAVAARRDGDTAYLERGERRD